MNDSLISCAKEGVKVWDFNLKSQKDHPLELASHEHHLAGQEKFCDLTRWDQMLIATTEASSGAYSVQLWSLQGHFHVIPQLVANESGRVRFHQGKLFKVEEEGMQVLDLMAHKSLFDSSKKSL